MSLQIPENIDRFNRVVLALFSLLYTSFPEPQDVDSKVLGVHASGDNFEGEGGRERAFAWMGVGRHTLVWLADEGFIRVAGRTIEDVHRGVVLTSKGFATVGHVPASLAENPEGKSFGTLAEETLATGAKDTISDVVKELFNYAIDWATGAL